MRARSLGGPFLMVWLAAVAIAQAPIEDFESGVWPTGAWSQVAGTTPATPSMAAAHDGSWGLVGVSGGSAWYATTGLTPIGSTGEKLWMWVQNPAGTGRTYMGFSDNGAGCFSLVYAPNTSTLIVMRNSGYSYQDLASTPFSYSGATWYRMEVEFNGGGSITGRLYDSGGTSVVATVNHTDPGIVPGQLALRSFGGLYNDSITLESFFCAHMAPMGGATVSGDVPIDLDVAAPGIMTTSLSLEHSIDGGLTWQPSTMGPTSPLPNPAVSVPVGAASFVWDSLADGVGLVTPQTTDLRCTSTDPMGTTTDCTVQVDVDNVPLSPVCTLAGPAGVAMNEVSCDVDVTFANSPTVDITLEFSSDAGATWATCTAAIGSPNPNPVLGVVLGVTTIVWDSRTDGVALAAQETLDVRAIVADGIAPTDGECQTMVDIDNTALCGGICGDCNLSTVGPDIIDALTAAQISVMLIVPGTEQAACCDVNVSGAVDVVDALLMAQAAAGLPAVMVCL